jgi:glycosyltransferase involved in cell wall biosynthesis
LNEWAHHSLTELLKSAAKRCRADLYIAHYVAALPAACSAARQYNAMCGFDAEDYHLGEFEQNEVNDVPARAVRKIEAAYIPQVRHFTAASKGISAAYSRTYEVSLPRVILNVFPRENAPRAPTKSGRAQPGPSIYWFSQTIGVNRGLECAVRAIAQAKSNPHLYLRGNFQSEIKTKLAEIAQPLGVEARIHYLLPAPGFEMERLASDYDIGLVAETCYTENRRIALTNKLFSYLLAGLPVVASDTQAHHELANACDAIFLYAVNSPAELSKAFDDLLLNPEALERARSESWAAGQYRYNWDLEQKKLVDAVCSHIGPPIMTGQSAICA